MLENLQVKHSIEEGGAHSWEHARFWQDARAAPAHQPRAHLPAAMASRSSA